jgi:hypothetical protein
MTRDFKIENYLTKRRPKGKNDYGECKVWSVFSFIHSKRRCKLVNNRVMKLAKVYVNTSISKMENAKKKKMIAMDYFKEDNIGLEEEEDEEDEEETDIIEK